MTIVLMYTEEDGTQQQVEFEDDVVKIDLSSKRIASIDLSPLATCTSLQVLTLVSNELQLLDLTPLATCTNLEGLNLYNNQLQSLDLTPLATCTSLQYLSLNSNQLQSLDLTPLSTCTNLEGLFLHNNQLPSLDLSPLATCTSLQELNLHNNMLQSLDLTPLYSCTSLRNLGLRFTQLYSIDAVYSWLRQEDAKYKRPISTYPWSFLYRIVEQFGTDRRVQQDILCAMGLKNYGFIDCDLSELFFSIPADTPIEMAREQVREKLLEEITRIVDIGGATTGLNVEELSKHHVELAKRVPWIIELREAEMQQVIVGVKDTEVDLRELWLTAYGYEVLTALESLFIGITTHSNSLRFVKRPISELGFSLKISRTSVSGVEMSDELKQDIWWIARNRGRSWAEL